MDIFVGNLPYGTTEESVAAYFAEYGTVERVKIITDRETGRSRGFCFVTMAEGVDADAVANEADGKEFEGRSLKVKKAEPREPRTGFGGRGESRGGGDRREGGYGPSRGRQGKGGGGHRGGGRDFDDDDRRRRPERRSRGGYDDYEGRGGRDY